MKKNTIYFLILILLGGVAVWLWYDSRESKNSTLEGPENYSFSERDTSAINKVVIRDKSPAEVVLEREDSKWLLNGEYKVRRDAIATLLETLYRMEMKNFVPRRMQQTVVKRMAVYGKEVEIYKNGKLLRTFYVGTETPDETATYMMIKGADQPYAVHIPGFNGFLSTRFFTQDYLWRSREIFKVQPENLTRIKIEYPDSSATGFILHLPESKSPYLQSAENDKVYQQLDPARLNLFLSAFKNLSFEGLIIKSDPIYARRDSLLNSTPVFTLEIETDKGEISTLSGYHIKPRSDYYDPDAERPDYDRDRMHGFINNKQMVLLQYYALEPVMKPLSYFLP